jgi:deoxyribodipyrimidine photo-lyase
VRATNYFQGGETAALVQLHKYFSKADQAVKAKGKGNNYQYFKLSPWLAVGCISPRQVYWEIFKHNDAQSGMLKLELLWRDYFRFMFKKHGQKFIQAKQAAKKLPVWKRC